MTQSLNELCHSVLASALQPDVQDSFQQELEREGGRPFLRALLHADNKMAWEKLHTGNWKDVPLIWRDAYTLACLLTAAAKLHPQQGPLFTASKVLAMRDLDLGVMMGGPRFRKQADELIAALHSALKVPPTMVKQDSETPAAASMQGCVPVEDEADQRSCKRRRAADPSRSGGTAEHASLPPARGPISLPPGSFEQPGQRLDVIAAPSLEQFWTQHMQPEAPVVISGAIDHWPAMNRWQDLDYLLATAGGRTVPVEIGTHYLADGWGQQLMLLSDFITQHVSTPAAAAFTGAGSAESPAPGRSHAAAGLSLQGADDAEVQQQDCGGDCQSSHEQLTAGAAQNVVKDALNRQPALGPDSVPTSWEGSGPDTGTGQVAAGQESSQPAGLSAREPQQQRGWVTAGGECGASNRVAYLAQHPLFDQVPELKQDILEPLYCCLGAGELQSINAWFGPAGTVTPLHYDPHHNLLAQVVGRKYVRLYPPCATAHLAPFESGQHTNSSQVDLDTPDFRRFPALQTLAFKDCILEPGQMLYIPPRHWHFVKSLDTSFSVTFWWK